MNQCTTLDTSIRHFHDVCGLTEIFDEQSQICIWQRDEPVGVTEYLQAIIGSGYTGPGFRKTVVVGEELSLDELPDLPGKAAMIRDMSGMLAIYADLLGCEHIGMRLEIVDQAMCPRFHVDRTGIRMLCTYRGPGTEYLTEAAADRGRLGAASMGLDDEISGVILDPAGMGQAPTFSVVLLKGALWQGNECLGAIHRSPKVPQAQCPRIALVLDAIW